MTKCYPLIHKPRQFVSRPQIAVPIVGEGRMNPEYLLTTEFVGDVYQGLCEAISEDRVQSAMIAYVPFPYENTNVRIIGSSQHQIDSRPSYYPIAASLALKDAVSKVLRMEE